MNLILQTHSIMAFILGLTAAGMFIHLVTQKQPVKAKKWLVAFYFGLLCWQFENVIRFSLPPDYTGSFAYKLDIIFILIPALSCMLISHTQYVYRFLVPAFERESKIVLWVSVCLSIAELTFVIWNEIYNGSDPDTMRLSGFLYSSIFTIWIIILSLRKATYLRTVDKRASKAHFIYAGINACYVCGSLISVFFGFYSIPGFWSYFLFIWFGNLASIVLYIVSAAVPASFQTKVTGFTYVLAATVLCIITLTFYPPNYSDLAVRMAQQDGLIRLLAITVIVAFFIVLLMPFMLKISITTPLQRLLAGVEQVNAGKLDTQVPVRLHDEIGLLTLNFNSMTQSLKKSQDELTEYAQTLEKKVAKRTAQLQHSFNELRSTQAQLIQSEKMASLGELTSGIAHEIKNPLNFVNNFSELTVELFTELNEEINKPSPDIKTLQELTEIIMQNLQKISHHGNRAGAIVSAMLEHSRASTGERELTDINELVKEYLDVSYEGMLIKDKNFSALLETQLDSTIEKVHIIPEDFGRVLLNLFNNAFYSVTEKKKKLNGTYEPKVSVCTKKINLLFPKDAIQESGEGGIEITVKDNGIGIPAHVLDKIYQPFFTTKPTGDGTGLGLSLSYDIITKGYKGELKVETKEGEFAEFIIVLPLKNNI